MPRTKATKLRVEDINLIHASAALDNVKQLYDENALNSLIDCGVSKFKIMTRDLLSEWPQKISDLTLGELEQLHSDVLTASDPTLQWNSGCTLGTTITLENTLQKNKSKLASGSSTSKLKPLSKTIKGKFRSTTNRTNIYQTPAYAQPAPLTYGSVTPKVAPNHPQIVLRRPKQGEMALSMQGSPLYTNTVVGEDSAHINIPLSGGTIMSIQPRKGLRASQLPELSPNTYRELDVLRDNLNKMCSVRKIKE